MFLRGGKPRLNAFSNDLNELTAGLLSGPLLLIVVLLGTLGK